jgi:hypothetical protein
MTVFCITARVEVGHILHMDNFLSDLFDAQHTAAVNCCEVSDNHKGMPGKSGNGKLKLKRRHMYYGEKCLDSNDLKDKCNVCTLTNRHKPMAKGNFCD